MSHETPDDPNIPDRLSTALQAALREATPGDPAPSAELRAALAARLAMAPFQSNTPLASSLTPHPNPRVTPMSAPKPNSGWGRVVATFAISALAASLAIAVFLPANERAQKAALREKAIRDQIASRTRAEFERLEQEGADVGQQAAELSRLSSSGKPLAVIDDSKSLSADMPKAEQPLVEYSMSSDLAAEASPGTTADFEAVVGPSSNVGQGQALPGRAVVGRPKKAVVSAGGIARSNETAARSYGINSSANPQPQNSNETGRLMFGVGINGPQQNQQGNQPQQPGKQQQPGQGPSTAPTGGGANLHDSATPFAPPAADPFGAPTAKSEPAYNFNHQANGAAAPNAAPRPTMNSPVPADPLAMKSDVGAQTLPSATYLNDDVQYFPTGPKFKLSQEAEKLKELAEQENRNKANDHRWHDAGGEQYEQRVENIFAGVRAAPLSTFSIDVDTASYTNCRRFLDGRQLPPTAAVRVEEFINYFRYDYPQPTNKDPFSVNMEMADCPWTPNHKLLRVGLKGKEIDRRERPESNLVFLVDVSGSMSSEDKLPLLREALHRWVNELSASDRVTIVTYAGDAGLRLPTTRGDQKDKLHAAIETLQSGGSTHGSAGIKLAYDEATKNFLENGGVNRVLWATDGDLNVGTTSDDELVELITNKAKTGVFLTVLGVGTGNLKDAKLEKMADKGNGIYAYLDSIKEARKVLIEQMSGTTITIAKDVKIQIEFNPAEIAGYRLIGYENRLLAAEDFANDKKDAGEIGAGHTVTALYEIIPVGAEEAKAAGPAGEPLKYQAATATAGANTAEVKLSDAAKTGELLTLKLRFKQPDGHKSELREFPLTERGGKFTAASRDFQFAGCVAQLAMILRDSQYRGTMTTAALAEIAAATRGDDKDGSRQEFVELVKRVQELGK